MRSRISNWLALAAVVAFGACADVPALPPVPHYDQAQLETIRMRAVLVAGDAGLPVFDNAVDAVGEWLHARAGVAPDRITQLSASPAVVERQGIGTTSWSDVVQAIENLNPGPGQGCFTFITSHGSRGAGVALSPGGVLSPDELDKALVRGCGNSPTVVIISACFSGGFAAPPMTRANRIIITAASADRPSFGCLAGATYTFFDSCLLDSLRHASWPLAGGGRPVLNERISWRRPAGANSSFFLARTWNNLYEATVSCVEKQETAGDYVPSHPQGWFGPAVANMALPEGRLGGS